MVIQVPLILQRTHSCCSITCTKTTWKPSEFLCDKRDFPSESFTVSFWLTCSQRERFHFLSLAFFTVLLHYHFPVTFSAVSLLGNSSQREGTANRGTPLLSTHPPEEKQILKHFLSTERLHPFSNIYAKKDLLPWWSALQPLSLHMAFKSTMVSLNVNKQMHMTQLSVDAVWKRPWGSPSSTADSCGKRQTEIFPKRVSDCQVQWSGNVSNVV